MHHERNNSAHNSPPPLSEVAPAWHSPGLWFRNTVEVPLLAPTSFRRSKYCVTCITRAILGWQVFPTLYFKNRRSAIDPSIACSHIDQSTAAISHCAHDHTYNVAIGENHWKWTYHHELNDFLRGDLDAPLKVHHRLTQAIDDCLSLASDTLALKVGSLSLCLSLQHQDASDTAYRFCRGWLQYSSRNIILALSYNLIPLQDQLWEL